MDWRIGDTHRRDRRIEMVGIHDKHRDKRIRIRKGPEVQDP